MKIEKVLVCAGLIGLAASLTFIAMARASGSGRLLGIAVASIVFPVLCFAFIIIERVGRKMVRKILEKRELKKAYRAAAFKRYADVTVDVPDVV